LVVFSRGQSVNALTVEQAAQHLGGFFMHLEALRQKVCTGLIVCRVS
jgi:hypothetical protein